MKRDITKKIWDSIKENKIILILFLLSTAYFVYQNIITLSWDFGSYVLNAKYWFSNGVYFEPLRPPLVPFILGILSIFGWKLAEIIFVVGVSSLFLYSTLKLAEKLEFNPIAFYAISLSTYVLTYGLANGTELLSIVFIELAIIFLLEDSMFSGLFLGLSALARYTCLTLFPLLLLHLNFKKILKSLILFGGILSVWFVYNYYKFGNFFTSIADQYANNIMYRSYIHQTPKLGHFMEAIGILIPFFIMGLIIVLYTLLKKIKPNKNDSKLRSTLEIIDKIKIELIIFFLLITSILGYINIPIKNVRYLFGMVIPILYFSYVGLSYLVKKIKGNQNLLVVIAIIIFIVSLIIASGSLSLKNSQEEIHKSAIDKLNELNISNCSLRSNDWVLLNYLGKPTLSSPRLSSLNETIKRGQIIIFFSDVPEPSYARNESLMKSYSKLYKNKDYTIIGKKGKCMPLNLSNDEYSSTFVNKVGDKYNSCYIFFNKLSIMEKTCNLINLNGFKKDIT